jgi:hypothetical protein
MTQPQIDRAVARRTGESLRTVRRLGFGPEVGLDPEDLALAVACPFCGRACRLAPGPDGPPAMAECDPCDVYFDYRPGDVRAVPATSAAEAA